jgi:hypothetical protein
MGVIDLITKTDAGPIVIDFKTGAVKAEHEHQVELYALLWWRAVGTLPKEIVVQYLGGVRRWAVTREGLEQREVLISAEIRDAARVLAIPPPPANTGSECSVCVVRARCEEGWKTSSQSGRNGSADLELIVASAPTMSGFSAVRADGTSISVVYAPLVSARLLSLHIGERVRILGAVRGADGAVEFKARTDVYRLPVAFYGEEQQNLRRSRSSTRGE